MIDPTLLKAQRALLAASDKIFEARQCFAALLAREDVEQNETSPTAHLIAHFHEDLSTLEMVVKKKAQQADNMNVNELLYDRDNCDETTDD